MRIGPALLKVEKEIAGQTHNNALSVV